MNKTIRSMEELQEVIDAFAKARDWEQFHSPKNLSMALSIETAELMEHFQWLKEEESYSLNSTTHQQVKDEIADVQVYLARLADQLNIDIWQAVTEKMKKNHQKYPADQVRGSAKKYTAYQDHE